MERPAGRDGCSRFETAGPACARAARLDRTIRTANTATGMLFDFDVGTLFDSRSATVDEGKDGSCGATTMPADGTIGEVGWGNNQHTLELSSCLTILPTPAKEEPRPAGFCRRSGYTHSASEGEMRILQSDDDADTDSIGTSGQAGGPDGTDARGGSRRSSVSGYTSDGPGICRHRGHARPTWTLPLRRAYTAQVRGRDGASAGFRVMRVISRAAGQPMPPPALRPGEQAGRSLGSGSLPRGSYRRQSLLCSIPEEREAEGQQSGPPPLAVPAVESAALTQEQLLLLSGPPRGVGEPAPQATASVATPSSGARSRLFVRGRSISDCSSGSRDWRSGSGSGSGSSVSRSIGRSASGSVGASINNRASAVGFVGTGVRPDYRRSQSAAPSVSGAVHSRAASVLVPADTPRCMEAGPSGRTADRTEHSHPRRQPASAPAPASRLTDVLASAAASVWYELSFSADSHGSSPVVEKAGSDAFWTAGYADCSANSGAGAAPGDARTRCGGRTAATPCVVPSPAAAAAAAAPAETTAAAGAERAPSVLWGLLSHVGRCACFGRSWGVRDLRLRQLPGIPRSKSGLATATALPEVPSAAHAAGDRDCRTPPATCIQRTAPPGCHGDARVASDPGPVGTRCDSSGTRPPTVLSPAHPPSPEVLQLNSLTPPPPVLATSLLRGGVLRRDLLLASEALVLGAQLCRVLADAATRQGVSPAEARGRGAPLFQRAMTAARAISHRPMRTLAQEVVWRYADPRRGAVDEAISELLAEACSFREEIPTARRQGPAFLGAELDRYSA